MTDEPRPMVMAVLEDGPLSGTTVEVPAVEGRPPKTIDVDRPGDLSARYCLAEWNQSGPSAIYCFLYDV